MKKTVFVAVVFSLLATPAAFAQYNPYGRPQAQGPVAKPGHVVEKKVVVKERRRWTKGQRLDNRYRHNVVSARDYSRYRLHNPPRGYQWVRADNDFVLVAVTTGLIASIIGAMN